MTAQHAIHELKQVRQYCSARAIPAIDYAIQVLQGLAERERMVGGGKGQRPQGPAQSDGFRIRSVSFCLISHRRPEGRRFFVSPCSYPQRV